MDSSEDTRLESSSEASSSGSQYSDFETVASDSQVQKATHLASRALDSRHQGMISGSLASVNMAKLAGYFEQAAHAQPKLHQQMVQSRGAIPEMKHKLRRMSNQYVWMSSVIETNAWLGQHANTYFTNTASMSGYSRINIARFVVAPLYGYR
ncbi:hypothetical protein JRO89_XS13G0126000 [Xanthoceras sorbifolium]|uniref:Uncharacterized protein n=1 Tax=Xanthoceras sorbifolium TaxID=99658 RepID=A0ABQ8H832_9ROSI|nr:hypothetical protein JRO89_XS13G0126000 [Xanthoceras sorbifolium]